MKLQFGKGIQKILQNNILDVGSQLLASERGYNFNEFVLKYQSPSIPMTRILVVNLGLFRLTIRTLTNMLFVLYEIYTCWLWYLCRHVLMHVYVLLLLENFTFLRFLSKGYICFFIFVLLMCICVFWCAKRSNFWYYLVLRGRCWIGFMF